MRSVWMGEKNEETLKTQTYGHSAISFTHIAFEQQINILEWFLKDHVTLKTGVMILKIQLCIEISCILQYIFYCNNTYYSYFK